MASKGRFIVLEGIDGCGKTTIALRLAKMLRSGQAKIIVTKEPTTQTATGKKIQVILQHKQPAPTAREMQQIYITDRFAHTKKIHAELAKGKTVICQRYAMSTFAYGSAFGVPHKDMEHDFLKPDITILLDLSAEEAMKRIASRKQGREYFEKKEKLAKIRKKYLGLANKFDAEIVDAKPAPEVIVERIWDILKKHGI